MRKMSAKGVCFLDNGIFYETSVKRKSDRELVMKKIIFVAIYVLSVIAWLVFGLATKEFIVAGVLIPITLGLLIFITWRYTSVEYEYTVVSNTMTVSVIYGKKSRKRILEIPLRDAVLIALLDDDTEEQAEKFSPHGVVPACSDINNENIYVILYEQDGERNVVYLDMTNEMLKCLKRINPSACIKK